MKKEKLNFTGGKILSKAEMKNVNGGLAQCGAPCNILGYPGDPDFMCGPGCPICMPSGAAYINYCAVRAAE